jgi:hypothetical protein
MILVALTDYNLGYTLEQIAARLKKKTSRNVSPSTITSWLVEYRQHCTAYAPMVSNDFLQYKRSAQLNFIIAKCTHMRIIGRSWISFGLER